MAHCASLPPFFRHCVDGGKRADALRRRSRAKLCDLHPCIGDHPYPPSLQAGLHSSSHCSGPWSPRAMRIRRGPRQRGPLGDVRAVAEYCAPSRLDIPFSLQLSSPSQDPQPRDTSATPPSLLLSRLSSLRLAALCLAARRDGRPLLPAGSAARATSEGRPPAGNAGMRHGRSKAGRSTGVFGGCAPEGTALQWPLFYLSAGCVGDSGRVLVWWKKSADSTH